MRHISTDSGSRAASDDTWTKRGTRAALAAASIAAVPATLPASNPAWSRALIDARDMDDGVGTGAQPVERRAVLERATDPFDTGAGLHRAAGEGADFMARAARRAEQSPTDKTGRAGNGQPHIGDQ